MLRVHALIYLAAGLMFVVATRAVSRFRTRQRGFIVMLTGSALLIVGSAWDVYGHAATTHVAPAHALTLRSRGGGRRGVPLLQWSFRSRDHNCVPWALEARTTTRARPGGGPESCAAAKASR